MPKHIAKIIVVTLLLGCISRISLASENELTVFYKLVDGHCLYEKSWNKVSGKVILWDIQNLKSGKLTWSHRYTFLSAKETSKSSILGVPQLRHFSVLYPFSDVYQLQSLKSINTQVKFLDQKKKELGDSSLELAQLVYETDEHSLFRLNELRDNNSFVKFSDAKVLLPGNLTVCKLKSNILMNGSKARFSKNLFGRVTITSDQTISVKTGEPSFATRVLKED
jgi:hypothetical protein